MKKQNVKNPILYRMTHIDNIEHILTYGITHKNSERANPNYKPIGDGEVISVRDHTPVPEEISLGGVLGDYIPFYFCPRSPMHYVIYKGYNSVGKVSESNIVYLISDVDSIVEAELPFIFTNGHAVSDLTLFFSSDETDKFRTLDWEVICNNYWRDTEEDPDRKRRKEAEFLIKRDVPVGCIIGLAVYNEEAKNRMEKLITSLGIDIRVAIRKNFYYD